MLHSSAKICIQTCWILIVAKVLDQTDQILAKNQKSIQGKIQEASRKCPYEQEGFGTFGSCIFHRGRYLPEVSWILPWIDFWFFAKIWSVWSKTLAAINNHHVWMHIFAELQSILSEAFYFFMLFLCKY